MMTSLAKIRLQAFSESIHDTKLAKCFTNTYEPLRIFRVRHDGSIPLKLLDFTAVLLVGQWWQTITISTAEVWHVFPAAEITGNVWVLFCGCQTCSHIHCNLTYKNIFSLNIFNRDEFGWSTFVMEKKPREFERDLFWLLNWKDFSHMSPTPLRIMR